MVYETLSIRGHSNIIIDDKQAISVLHFNRETLNTAFVPNTIIRWVPFHFKLIRSSMCKGSITDISSIAEPIWLNSKL